jgi:pyruvate kinase
MSTSTPPRSAGWDSGHVPHRSVGPVFGPVTGDAPAAKTRTKIVATLGPATSDINMLLELFAANVGVCRLNFSHGEMAHHQRILANVREAAAVWGRPIAVLGDLCGPKIRLGEVADVENAGGLRIATNEELIIQREEIVGGVHASQRRVSCTYPSFVDDVKAGHRVLIEDGMVRFVCTQTSATEVRCRCTVGGILRSSKGINLPDSHVNAPSFTERDAECARWAIDNNLDYLALSFVRRAEDLHLLRRNLGEKAGAISLIAKIEKAEAVREIDAIIEAADGLMVARGDLGVEMDVAEVPIVQKDLIRRCQTAGKPVIVATQMLQSMIEQPNPTRAEVSDVANAVYDGTDALMLSGETSVGKYPLQAVQMMAHVAATTEQYVETHTDRRRDVVHVRATGPSSALAHGVLQITRDVGAKAVVVWTRTGNTPRVFAKYRFAVPIVALSDQEHILRRAALYYGVIPEPMASPADLVKLVEAVDSLVQRRHYASRGDRIVLVAGWSPGTPGTMNGLLVHTVGAAWDVVPH